MIKDWVGIPFLYANLEVALIIVLSTLDKMCCPIEAVELNRGFLLFDVMLLPIQLSPTIFHFLHYFVDDMLDGDRSFM